MIPLREEQNDKGEAYRLSGVDPPVLSRGLRDMGWQGKDAVRTRGGGGQDLDRTPLPLEAQVKRSIVLIPYETYLFLSTRSSIRWSVRSISHSVSDCCAFYGHSLCPWLRIISGSVPSRHLTLAVEKMTIGHIQWKIQHFHFCMSRSTRLKYS